LKVKIMDIIMAPATFEVALENESILYKDKYKKIYELAKKYFHSLNVGGDYDLRGICKYMLLSYVDDKRIILNDINDLLDEMNIVIYVNYKYHYINSAVDGGEVTFLTQNSMNRLRWEIYSHGISVEDPRQFGIEQPLLRISNNPGLFQIYKFSFNINTKEALCSAE